MLIAGCLRGRRQQLGSVGRAGAEPCPALLPGAAVLGAVCWCCAPAEPALPLPNTCDRQPGQKKSRQSSGELQGKVSLVASAAAGLFGVLLAWWRRKVFKIRKSVWKEIYSRSSLKLFSFFFLEVYMLHIDNCFIFIQVQHFHGCSLRVGNVWPRSGKGLTKARREAGPE